MQLAVRFALVLLVLSVAYLAYRFVRDEVRRRRLARRQGKTAWEAVRQAEESLQAVYDKRDAARAEAEAAEKFIVFGKSEENGKGA